jgi:hypothetical protein
LEFYNLHNLKIGPNKKAEHELVKSELDRLFESQTLRIIYSVSMALFGFVINFLIKKKKESN